MKRILLLAVAAALPGAAAAAGAGASAMANAKVAFYAGFPGSGGTQLASMPAAQALRASARQDVEKADSIVVTVSGRAYAFALAKSARSKGRLVLVVKGAVKPTAPGQAGLASVVDDLSKAQQGRYPLVVLARAQGSGRVVVALYHPQGDDAGLRVKDAAYATVWVNGRAHAYKVSSKAGSGVMASLQLQGRGGEHPLPQTLASLETKALLSLASSTKTSSSRNVPSSGSSSSGSSGGASVQVGGNGGVSVNVGGGN